MTIALAALASTGTGSTSPAAGNPTACEENDSQLDSLRKAFFFAFPLYEMTRMRQRMLSAPGAGPNRLLHRTALSRPSDRTITTPNTDTLYSAAWLDLSGGPVEFSIPPMGPRYHSIELMHSFTDAFAMLRNESDGARTFLIVGPHWDGQAPSSLTVIRSPTNDAWLVIRTFVQGPTDLTEAQRLQSSFALSATHRSTDAASARDIVPTKPVATEFLSVVNAALARGPLPPGQQDRLACFADAGIRPNQPSLTETFDPEVLKLWDANIPAFYEQVRLAFENSGSLDDGWRYPAPHIAAFGNDDLYRSAMALGGLAAMPLEEAVNPLAVADSEGKQLSGGSRYRVSIPVDVPVDGFWSLTMYEAGEAGRWYLYANSLHRYSINSAMTGLRREPDGSIFVDLSHENPNAEINWLPAPKGKFMIVFRAYRPRPEFIDGRFRLPPIVRIAH